MSLLERQPASRRVVDYCVPGPAVGETNIKRGRFGLAAFQPQHAAHIARWARSPQDLRWLAPNTPPPLTAAKVIAWKKEGDQAFVFLGPDEVLPLGYGELNPMRDDYAHCWLGHVVVGPEQRRRGLGRVLLQLLLAEAFDARSAQRVSLIVFPDNGAAIGCYQRGGFVKTGEEFHQFRSSTTLHRLWRMELHRAAWDEHRKTSYATS